MIDGKIFFDYSIKNDSIAYENIWNIATGQGDDYTTGCLLDYNDFKNYYKMWPIDLSKKRLMLIQEQYCKSVLLQILIEQDKQQCFLLLKKQKKSF